MTVVIQHPASRAVGMLRKLGARRLRDRFELASIKGTKPMREILLLLLRKPGMHFNIAFMLCDPQVTEVHEL